GCNPTNSTPNPTPSPPPVTGCVTQNSVPLTLLCTFNLSLNNSTFGPPLPPLPGYSCAPGSARALGQSATGTAILTYGLDNFDSDNETKIGLGVTNGAYAGLVAPIRQLDPTCTQVLTAVAVQATFQLSHISIIDKQTLPTCVYRSRISFQSFIVTGLPVFAHPQMPAAFQDGIQADLWRKLDRMVAERMNELLNQDQLTPMPPQATGRCSDWAVLVE
ncbi:MAG: hypothetical protein HY870_16425, partial [Chloroflexi bacterium]|nr:hypothetical protein [Chloroflexota bacterium]